MTEREMEDLLYSYPQLLIGEPLKAVARQRSSTVGRVDLVFEHPNGYRLVVEVKLGRAPRGVGNQLFDYYGAEKAAYPDTPIEMMVVANEIPSERRLFLEKRDIEAKEIPMRKFRDVAAKVGYIFSSEQKTEATPQPRPLKEPSSQTESARIRVSPGATSLALLMNLDPPQFKNLVEWRDDYVWLGTKTKNRKISEFPVGSNYVYFKENKGSRTRTEKRLMVGFRAQLIEIRRDAPDDPQHRLLGFENDKSGLYYLKIRKPVSLGDPIPMESMFYENGNQITNNQGVNVIQDPLTTP